MKHIYFYRIVIGLVLAGAVSLHAQSRMSYLFYDKTAQLQKEIYAFVSNDLLYTAFPAKVAFLRECTTLSKDAIQIIRQITPDMKEGKNHHLLAHFIEAKNTMKQILSSHSSPQEMRSLVATARTINQELLPVFAQPKPALTPSQQLLYTLRHMQMLLEEMLFDYTVQYHHKGETEAQKDMTRSMKQFDADLREVLAYPDWQPDARPLQSRIRRGWGVLHPTLRQANLPLVVEVATHHLSSLLHSLHQMQANQNEDLR